MRHVALASCGLWPTGRGDHAGLAEAIAARGAAADWIPWDRPGVDWSAYDLVLLRETWDYPSRLGRFLGWVEDTAAVTTVANAASVVRWNHHKGYLVELAAAGVPTGPTAVVPASSDPEAALAPHGSARVVVKPAVGIGGDDAERAPADDPALHAHLSRLLVTGDGLVQPYQASIETSGETSLIVFADRVSHAVAKRPAAGEFRIHDHRGGTYAEVEPTPEQHELAVAACEVASSITGHPLLYARADLVDGEDGRPHLMELELIEPLLYLHTVPSATGALADAIVASVG